VSGSVSLSFVIAVACRSEQPAYKHVDDVRVAFARVRQTARSRPLVQTVRTFHRRLQDFSSLNQSIDQSFDQNVSPVKKTCNQTLVYRAGFNPD